MPEKKPSMPFRCLLNVVKCLQLSIKLAQPVQGLIDLLPDTVMIPEAWQQTLASWSTPYHLIQAPDKLGTSVSSLLELAYLDWHGFASRLVRSLAVLWSTSGRQLRPIS